MTKRLPTAIALFAVVLAFACSSERRSEGFAARTRDYRADVAADGSLVMTGKSGDAITLGPARVERGSASLPRGAAVEHLVARREGVEQSWRFDGRPSGRGAVVVRERLVAASRPSVFERGVRAGGFSVREAAWIDATGARTPLRISLEGDDVVVRVPEDVIESSSYPATLDPTIGPELGLDDPVVSLHDSGIYSTRVAPGKNGRAFVVWADERIQQPISNSIFDGDQSFGTRIDPNGTVLDTTGIPVMTHRDAYLEDQAITFDGVDKWFVTWTESSSNSFCGLLWGAVVSDQGTVLSSKEAAGGCSGGLVGAGFDGTSFITMLSQNGGVYLTRFSPAGEPLDSLPKLVGPSTSNAAFACRTGGCLVAWSGASGARATRIGANLAVVDASPLVLGAAAGRVKGVVFDGDSWVVAVGASLVRVDPTNGTVTGPVAIAAEPSSVAADGTNTWAIWATAGAIQADRITRQGTLVAGGPLTLASGLTVDANTDPSIAFSGTTGWVAWDDDRVHSLSDAYVMRITPAGASLDGTGIALNKSANGQGRPALATNGLGFLVGWVDELASAASGRIGAFVGRLDANGLSLDAVATPIDPVASSIALASDGSDYLAVTTSASGVKATRVSAATGDAVAAPATLSGASASKASVTYDGTQFVAVWFESTGVRGARVSTAGAIVGPTFDIPASGSAFDYARTGIASDGATSLAVWSSSGVFGARIDKSGNVLDATPIVIGQSFGDIQAPAVTWDGTQYVVVWEDFRSGHIIDSETYAARVTSAGAVVQTPAKEILVAGGTGVSAYPSVVSMNDDYSDLVVWTDNRNQTRYQDFALLGTWIRRSDGKVIDENPVVISDRAGNEMFSAAAPAGKGRVLVAYQTTDYSPGFGSYRVRARFVGSGSALGATCAQDEDCVTRACADGVCCDRACTGTCETCGGTGGKCTAVVNAEDADSCNGDRVCSATSECRRNAGRGCTVNADCVTGSCSDGICCERACDGACEACAALTGKCELRSARSQGTPACAPYACNGESSTCPTSCASDLACPVGSRCENGVCAAGASCISSTIAALVDESRIDCKPYTCAGGDCRTSCRSIADCAAGFFCDENGACVLPPEYIAPAEGGCATSNRRSVHSSSDGLAFAFALLAAGAIAARRRRR